MLHLETKIQSKMTEIESLKNQIKTQQRAMTDVEKTSYTNLLTEVEGLAGELELHKRQESVFSKISTSTGIPTRPDVNFSTSSSTGPFKSFGEQLQSIYRAAQDGQKVDQRLYEVRAAGMSESVPSDGGFLIQQDFSDKLLKSVYETGNLAKMCMNYPVGQGSNAVNLPAFDESSRVSSRLGGVLSYWQGEGSLLLDSKPKLRSVSLTLKKLTALCYATDEIVEDTNLLEKIVVNGMLHELGFRIDDAIIRGTGAGMPLGILTADSTVSVPIEAGQLADTIQVDNILKMWARLLPGSHSTAVWLVNANCIPQLYSMGVSVGVGGVPIFMPSGSIAGNPYNTILGRPVLMIEQAASVGDVGDIILGDFANGYVIADKGAPKSASSIHVRFTNDEMTYRAVVRIDGSPVLATSLTPYKGSDALAHFVTLAERA